MAGVGELFENAKANGLYIFPPPNGSVMLSDKDQVWSTFTGNNVKEYNKSKGVSDTKFLKQDGRFAWCSNHLITWIAIRQETYDELILSKEKQLPLFPLAPTTCVPTEFNIYKITRETKTDAWDINISYIVVAIDEYNARKLCDDDDDNGYDGGKIFNDRRYSSCVIIGKSCTTAPTIILKEFLSG